MIEKLSGVDKVVSHSVSLKVDEIIDAIETLSRDVGHLRGAFRGNNSVVERNFDQVHDKINLVMFEGTLANLGKRKDDDSYINENGDRCSKETWTWIYPLGPKIKPKEPLFYCVPRELRVNRRKETRRIARILPCFFTRRRDFIYGRREEDNLRTQYPNRRSSPYKNQQSYNLYRRQSDKDERRRMDSEVGI